MALGTFVKGMADIPSLKEPMLRRFGWTLRTTRLTVYKSNTGNGSCRHYFSVSVAGPLGGLLAEGVVDLQPSLETLIDLVVIHLAILVSQYVPESDGRDECVHRFPLNYPPRPRTRIATLAASPSKSKSCVSDVLGEVGTRLNGVLEHPLDGALLCRIREEILAG